MRTTNCDPVGIVQAVLAAFADVGCVTRSVLDRNRGPSPALGWDVAADAAGVAGVVDVELEDRATGWVEVDGVGEVVAVLSSPN